MSRHNLPTLSPVSAQAWLISDDHTGVDLYFSYQTLCAFRHPATGLVVRENDWGPTTGKHLNAIDGGDKKARLSAEAFEAKYRETFA